MTDPALGISSRPSSRTRRHVDTYAMQRTTITADDLLTASATELLDLVLEGRLSPTASVVVKSRLLELGIEIA